MIVSKTLQGSLELILLKSGNISHNSHFSTLFPQFSFLYFIFTILISLLYFHTNHLCSTTINSCKETDRKTRGSPVLTFCCVMIFFLAHVLRLLMHE